MEKVATNQLSTLINSLDGNNIIKVMIERRKLIGMIARDPPVEGFLNKTHIHQNFFTPKMCKWIIDETEHHSIKNGGWTKKRHKNYPTTDIPVISIPLLSTPLLNYCNIHILPLISKHYKMNFYFLNIADLFVVKYDVNGQDHLDWHRDGSIISFNILLNDDFTEGGTAIEHKTESGIKEIIYTSNKGDLFIHPGKLRHCGRRITSGTRYIIVGFVEYCSRLIKTFTPESMDNDNMPRNEDH